MKVFVICNQFRMQQYLENGQNTLVDISMVTLKMFQRGKQDLGMLCTKCQI